MFLSDPFMEGSQQVSNQCLPWASCSALTRSCSSRNCFPVSPPIPKSSSSSSAWALILPEDGPCFIKNSSCWSKRSPCSIQAESCLYMTPWQTARILRREGSKSLPLPVHLREYQDSPLPEIMLEILRGQTKA